MRRRLATCLAAPAAVLALAASGCGGDDRDKAVGPPAPSKSFVGVTAEDVFARPGEYRRRQLALQAKHGVGLIRQTFDWERIEPERGKYDLDYYDDYVSDLARARVSVLPILFNAPSFYARALPDGEEGETPPRDPEDLARFATVLVRRYGPNGSLWKERPDVPRRPIRSWQVWNEPNLPVYWGGRPDAEEYTELLRTTARALHKADKGAQVVTAGMPESKLGVPFEEYLRDMYAAGAQDAFDVLAVNAYSRQVRGVISAVTRARRVLSSAGDGDLPIWVTEFGWASQGPGSSFSVGRRGQAVNVRRAIRLLNQGKERLGIRGFVYYAWRDAPPYAGGKDFWGLHTGLLTREGRQKPAARSFRRQVELIRTRRLNFPVGDRKKD